MVSRYYDITVCLSGEKMDDFAKEMLDWALELKYDRFCFSYLFKEDLPKEIWRFKIREVPSGRPALSFDFDSAGQVGRKSSKEMVFEGKLNKASARVLLKIAWGGPAIDMFKAYRSGWDLTKNLPHPHLLAKVTGRVQLQCTNHEEQFDLDFATPGDLKRVRQIVKKIGLKAKEEEIKETVSLLMDARENR